MSLLNNVLPYSKEALPHIFEAVDYTIFLPWIILTKITIMAITSRMWMRPPAANPRNPIAQPSIRITATMYNKFPMILFSFLIYDIFMLFTFN